MGTTRRRLVAGIFVHDANNALSPMMATAEQLVALDVATVTRARGDDRGRLQTTLGADASLARP